MPHIITLCCIFSNKTLIFFVDLYLIVWGPSVFISWTTVSLQLCPFCSDETFSSEENMALYFTESSKGYSSLHRLLMNMHIISELPVAPVFLTVEKNDKRHPLICLWVKKDGLLRHGKRHMSEDKCVWNIELLNLVQSLDSFCLCKLSFLLNHISFDRETCLIFCQMAKCIKWVSFLAEYVLLLFM